jgi:hypothetical protein
MDAKILDHNEKSGASVNRLTIFMDGFMDGSSQDSKLCVKSPQFSTSFVKIAVRRYLNDIDDIDKRSTYSPRAGLQVLLDGKPSGRTSLGKWRAAVWQSCCTGITAADRAVRV